MSGSYAAKPWLAQYSPFVPRSMPPAERSLIDVFEQTARLRPDAPALRYFEDTTSFGRLDDLASRFASLLAKRGIGKGDRVAILTQNDPEFVIAQYGAWKRGAIVVPLNPMFKWKELEYHLSDSGARALVKLDELETPPVEHTFTVGEFRERLGGEAPEDGAREPVTPDDIAYLVYTSGTTGPPKGAMCLHRNIAFNAEVYRTWMRIGPDDGLLGMAPLFHITGIVAGMALSALAGAPLILYHRFDAAETLRLVERWRPTMTVAAITAYIALMNHPDSATRDFRSMTKCYSGGAPVAPGVGARFQERLGAYIHNIYGLTESNSPSHATPLDGRAPVDPASGALSIGVPIPDCEAKVVDLADRDREAAPGEMGELALKGPMMFPGYWNKPEETARAHHGGYFLTGDVAVMDERGWFYLVDRKKDMIVASGFKVWPREVEDVLYQHPAVKEAAVVGVPDEYRGETVKAYVALRSDWVGRVSADEIVAFCKERMAAYKYPRQVEFRDEIPKTATGKFLRRALK
jgi:long-chain acyl-CoA synthetase